MPWATSWISSCALFRLASNDEPATPANRAALAGAPTRETGFRRPLLQQDPTPLDIQRGVGNELSVANLYRHISGARPVAFLVERDFAGRAVIAFERVQRGRDIGWLGRLRVFDGLGRDADRIVFVDRVGAGW